MGVLILGAREKALIAECVNKAKQTPLPWEAGEMIADSTDTLSLDLANRPPNTTEIRKRYPPQMLELGTYQVSLTFEHQPAGLLRHLSISSIRKGTLPGLEVLAMVVAEFGFSGWPLQRPGHVWTEEFRPGHYAVNVLELEEAA